MLTNLLGNAIKFTTTGRVSLSVTLAEDSEPAAVGDGVRWVRFEVEDTGPGISAVELASVFEAFVQTETGRRSQEGTGLGLPISQRFVQLLGGTISVDSEVGRGSSFRFTLPLTEVGAEGIASHPNRQRVVALASGQPTYRILVVDDKPESRRILRGLLSPLGFEVREAGDGAEAIEVWLAWRPHLIWMDMRMPGTDGYQATQEIRRLEAEADDEAVSQKTTIVALTATVFDRSSNVAIAAGCDDFVSKPFRDETIFEKISQYLGVRFICQETQTQDKEAIEIELESLSPELLSEMPLDWIEALHQAALSAREKHIREAIDRVRDSRPDLAHILSYLLDRFLFDRIVDLTESFIS
ncbi:ATP-binding protein [Baaleninema sp.]|uniref:ATP-binding protein n=1 Tax=Baaleninema sp. TaxID=3101197 RepID=UPI003D08DF7F